jgi:cytochrome c oxidase cbb3-type subunit 3
MARLYALAVLAILTAAALAAGKDARPDSAAVAAGAKLYSQYCLICHGKTGAGDGPGAAGLKPKPRNFRDPKQLKSKSDEDLFKVISKGGPALGLSPLMVGWGSVLKEPQIRQVRAYVRSLAATSGAKPKAK